MLRVITESRGLPRHDKVVSTKEGGTGLTTKESVIQYLGAVSENEIGQEGGPVPLVGGVLPDVYINDTELLPVAVHGSKSVLAGSQNDYYITAYDILGKYEVVALRGLVTRVDNIIRYVAPQEAGSAGFYLNGKLCRVTVVPMDGEGSEPRVYRPVIEYPINGSTLGDGVVQVLSSPFAATEGETHVSSDWELSMDLAFSQVMKSAYDSAASLTSWGIVDMLPDTQYYVRVRHRGANAGVSEWSDPVAFKTAQEGGLEETGIWYGPSTSSYFGYSVSLSADGNTALVGAPYWNSYTGKALVYTRSGSTWTQQADLPHGLGYSSNFGYSVALSADGNTALVGAPVWNANTGKALVYIRSGSTWTQQADLPHTLGASSAFGWSVALSADGSTALVGAYIWNSYAGKALVYTRSGSTWTQQADLPHALGTYSNFGYSVALSADGSTALVGAYSWNSTTGKALVYTRSGSTWTQQADLPHTLGASSAFGWSVALSADGNTALVGAYLIAKALVYTRSGGAWTQQADLPHGLGASSGFGYCVALSADGNTALVGASDWNSTTSKALAYTRSGSTWTLDRELDNPLGSGRFGSSVAISGDTSAALVGAPNYNSNTGFVAVYEQAIPAPGVLEDVLVAEFTGPTTGSYFGHSVALSADGNTALVGAYTVNKALVYTRSGSTWTQQADLAHALGAGGYFGWSVALSADGNTALVGAPYWSSINGKALVYTRNGGTWTQQADLPHALVAQSYFGHSVALSVDGNTALVAAYRWNSDTGKALVYTRSDSTWTQQADLPHALGEGSQFGQSVSLSADGNTALVGARAWNTNTGKVLVYTRSGGTWAQQADLPHGLTGSVFGHSVSLSADGNTALVGAYGWNSLSGKVLVYTRSGSTWVQRADLPHALAAQSFFGASVTLSADGNTALVGAYFWNSFTGKALVYTRIAGAWFLRRELTGVASSQFGQSVSLSGDGSQALIGAPAFSASAGKVFFYGHPDAKPTLQGISVAEFTGPTGGSQFGYSVSLSSDGNTALVGAYQWNAYTGKAFVYTRSGSTWTYQADLPHSLGESSYFGYCTALSADGNTALVGVYNWSSRTGKVLVYTRSGSTWTQQADLPHALEAGNQFGVSVALSADGNTALVGANVWNLSTGKVFVYTRSGSTWTQQADLPHSLGTNSTFGNSVALSADGNTALVGAYAWSISTGKALVYTRSGSSWTQQADLPHVLGQSQFGYSVSLSADGNTALVGAPYWNSGTGKAFVYTRSGSTWTQQADLPHSLGTSYFGASVSLSADGNTALVGTPYWNSNTGKALVYTRIAGMWFLRREFMGVAASQFGQSVSLSGDGSQALIGAPTFSSNTGKAFFYQ